MTNYEIAKITFEAFRSLGEKTRIKARGGDKDAAKKVLSQLAAESIVLKQFGYAVGDSGRLKKYKVTKRDEKFNALSLKASDGDIDASKELLGILTKHKKL